MQNNKVTVFGQAVIAALSDRLTKIKAADANLDEMASLEAKAEQALLGLGFINDPTFVSYTASCSHTIRLVPMLTRSILIEAICLGARAVRAADEARDLERSIQS